MRKRFEAPAVGLAASGRTVSITACIDRLQKTGFEVDPELAQSHSREVFQGLDNDKKGWLNRTELRAGFRMNGLEVGNTEFEDLWKVADADGDGAISLREFQAVWELGFVKNEIARLEAEMEEEIARTKAQMEEKRKRRAEKWAKNQT